MKPVMSSHRYARASVHGRFQGFHLGHEEYLRAALHQCDYLFVGLAMPDPKDLRGREVAPHRHVDGSNPFTYYEREEMVRAFLASEGVSESCFRVHPFPIDDVRAIENYLPPRTEVTLLTTVYDQWGEYKSGILEQLGYDVQVLWRRTYDTRITSGAEVRRRMREGEDFEALLSPAVTAAVQRLGLAHRLRAGRLSQSADRTSSDRLGTWSEIDPIRH